MKPFRTANWIVTLVACMVCRNLVSAQDVSCDHINSLARLARAKSPEVLAVERRKAGDDYRAQVVFAARMLELQPKERRAAVLLLSLIPKDDGQQAIWMTFGDSLCDSEPLSDMKSLDRLGERLPRALARAVLLAPEKMLDYVSYARISIQDPHSDYAQQMQSVCRAKHLTFKEAIDKLSPDNKDWFVKHIFNPGECHALALPEAR